MARFKPLFRFILKFYFDGKYLSGKYFDEDVLGYVWALRSVWQRNILRLGPPRPWPVVLTCQISDPARIFFHPDDINNFQSQGTYFQNFSANIHLGRGVYIAPNVGLITANHDVKNPSLHMDGKDICIGDGCWVGMNSVILPGVSLGPGTVVAAGSVVTKSFLDGWQIIGGVPARALKNIQRC